MAHGNFFPTMQLEQGAPRGVRADCLGGQRSVGPPGARSRDRRGRRRPSSRAVGSSSARPRAPRRSRTVASSRTNGRRTSSTSAGARTDSRQGLRTGTPWCASSSRAGAPSATARRVLERAHLLLALSAGASCSARTKKSRGSRIRVLPGLPRRTRTGATLRDLELAARDALGGVLLELEGDDTLRSRRSARQSAVTLATDATLVTLPVDQGDKDEEAPTGCGS